MDKFQAAYEILVVLSMIDGEMHEKEIKVINEFVGDNLGKSDFDTRAVAKSLANLTFKGRVEEMGRAAAIIHTTCSAQEKQSILDFALRLVAADEKLTDEEVAAFVLLGKSWNINIDAFMARYR